MVVIPFTNDSPVRIKGGGGGARSPLEGLLKINCLVLPAMYNQSLYQSPYPEWPCLTGHSVTLT